MFDHRIKTLGLVIVAALSIVLFAGCAPDEGGSDPQPSPPQLGDTLRVRMHYDYSEYYPDAVAVYTERVLNHEGMLLQQRTYQDFYGDPLLIYNNISRELIYNNEGRLVSEWQPKLSTASGIVKYAYTWDNTGRIIRQTFDFYDSERVFQSAESDLAFTYDEAGRLSGVTESGAGTYTIIHYDYSYNEAGQISLIVESAEGSSTTTSTTLLYNEAGQLLEMYRTNTPAYFYHAHWTYDAHGNGTSWYYETENGISSVGDWTAQFSYDEQDRIISSSRNGGASTLFVYRPDGKLDYFGADADDDGVVDTGSSFVQLEYIGTTAIPYDLQSFQTRWFFYPRLIYGEQNFSRSVVDLND